MYHPCGLMGSPSTEHLYCRHRGRGLAQLAAMPRRAAELRRATALTARSEQVRSPRAWWFKDQRAPAWAPRAYWA